MRPLTLLVLLATVAWSTAASPRDASAETGDVERTVLALYDSGVEIAPEVTQLHRMVELPMNHLGLKVIYADIAAGLPAWSNEFRGVVTCFPTGYRNRAPVEYLRWARSIVEKGGRFAVLCDPGFFFDSSGAATATEEIDAFLRMVGVSYGGANAVFPGELTFPILDRTMVGFERTPPGVVDSMPLTRALEQRAWTFLSAEAPGGKRADLIVTSEHGCYAQDEFSIFSRYLGSRGDSRQWVLNPFEFLRRCFATDDLPKPEPSIVNGNRAAFGFVDARGAMPDVGATLRGRRLSAASLVRHDVIDAFGEAPLGTAVDAVDRELFDGMESRVERFDAPPRPDDRDAGMASRSRRAFESVLRRFVERRVSGVDSAEFPQAGCEVRDIEGDGEGDCALAFWSTVGQRKFDLLSMLPPYATSSGAAYFPVPAEKEFFESSGQLPVAYRAVAGVLDRTWQPRVLKPAAFAFDLGIVSHEERLRSVRSAVRSIEGDSTFPLSPSEYVRAVRGWRSIRFRQLSSLEWEVLDRGDISTVRFDRIGVYPDLDRSTGVTGYRVLGSSLFVSLDSAVAAPRVVLGPRVPDSASISQSTWSIRSFNRSRHRVTFETRGRGHGVVRIANPHDEPYRLTEAETGAELRSESRVIIVRLPETNEQRWRRVILESAPAKAVAP